MLRILLRFSAVDDSATNLEMDGKGDGLFVSEGLNPLLVEDDSRNREFMRLLLKRYEFEADFAESGAAALGAPFVEDL